MTLVKARNISLMNTKESTGDPELNTSRVKSRIRVDSERRLVEGKVTEWDLELKENEELR